MIRNRFDEIPSTISNIPNTFATFRGKVFTIFIFSNAEFRVSLTFKNTKISLPNGPFINDKEKEVTNLAKKAVLIRIQNLKMLVVRPAIYNPIFLNMHMHF